MKKKAAIELSVNFLVIIIIAISVFAMGLYLAGKILFSVNTQVEDMDAQTRREIDRALTTGEKVAVGLNSASIKRGKFHTFGVGIRNDGDCGNEFEIQTTYSLGVSQSNVPIDEVTSEEVERSWLISSREVIVEPYTKDFFSIPITPLKKSPYGNYVFDVIVLCSQTGNQYGKLQKLYLEIK